MLYVASNEFRSRDVAQLVSLTSAEIPAASKPQTVTEKENWLENVDR